MSSRGKEFAVENQNDVIQNSSRTPVRSEALITAREPSQAADAIKWPRPPELSELEKIEDRIFVAGYFCLGDLKATSA